jgi:myo-inositol-1(or 4)-monophosphatase
MPIPEELLRLAIQAARTAGMDLARQWSPGGAIVTLESAHDVKIDADRRSEELILGILLRHTGVPIMTEEAGRVGASDGTSGLVWIVDPLDGSVNYMMGIPFCCVSVGLWQDGAPLAGVVFDFLRDELFAGIIGEGAWLNGRSIRMRETSRPEAAVLCTGIPAGSDFSSDALADFVRYVRQYRKVRLLGSAALSLVYIASGRADLYHERNIKLWDVAAGLAVLQAAGGTVVRTPVRDDMFTVYAGAPPLVAGLAGRP